MQLHIADLQAKMAEQRAKAGATAAHVEQTKVEYAQLSQAAAAAATGGLGPAGAPEGTHTPVPGMVSIAFAEAKWAEREAAFAQQLAEAQALVSSQPEAPIEACDVELPDRVEEDEVWSKIESGERQQL